jgi:hypothetical protein
MCCSRMILLGDASNRLPYRPSNALCNRPQGPLGFSTVAGGTEFFALVRARFAFSRAG